MRLVDVVFRQGHLSERALIEAVMTGERPAHLERCDLCAERAVDLGRWLDEARTIGHEAADAVFTPERLAAQQTQILRRLEQLDQPSRVIAFPQARPDQRESTGRRVAASWVGVAAAAGLVIGVVGGQLTARMGAPVRPAPIVQQATQAEPEPEIGPVDSSLLDQDFDSVLIKSMEAVDELTPRIQASARIGG